MQNGYYDAALQKLNTANTAQIQKTPLSRREQKNLPDWDREGYYAF